MSTNAVHPGKRLRVLFATAHKAGDLVYCKGFYGTVQDDMAAGKWGTLILDGVWAFARAANNLAMGTVVSAPATETATSLPLGAAAATVGAVATTGWFPIGRTIATGGPTGVVKVQLFNPNPVY